MSNDISSVEYLLQNPHLIKFAFQPIYRIKDYSIYGYEALMRPGKMSPIDFINRVAEMDKLYIIEEITNYYGVKNFMDLKLEGKIFLNSFPSVCMRVSEAKKVAALGGDYMKDRLVYEILEYTHFEKYAWAMKRAAFLSEGATPLVAIDDFGTGSNIDEECLDFYNPNLVKIDRKYVSGIDKNISNQIIVDKIISILRKKNIMILAEGIETEEEYKYFKEKKIDFAQGYFLGKPMIYDNKKIIDFKKVI
ncbi:MAG: EAL domain-containing protein [Butyrivibrio sp.]|nr:EAL domain-containing protein [Butyrivibrio sp.]